MSDHSCDCGGEYPDVGRTEMRIARKQHKCYECSKAIQKDERYEFNTQLYDSHWSVAKTCCRCLAVREYVEAHAPCFCWMYGSMLDDAKAVIEEHGHESAGFYIGAMKRVLRAERHQGSAC